MSEQLKTTSDTPERQQHVTFYSTAERQQQQQEQLQLQKTTGSVTVSQTQEWVTHAQVVPEEPQPTCNKDRPVTLMPASKRQEEPLQNVQHEPLKSDE